MKKNTFLICFLLLFLTCCFEDCPTTLDNSAFLVVDIKAIYERVNPITSPLYEDKVTIYFGQLGGWQQTEMVKVGDNKYEVSYQLHVGDRFDIDEGKYETYIFDGKLWPNSRVARKIFLNGKELKCVVPLIIQGEKAGEKAVFIVDKNGSISDGDEC